MRDPWLKRWPAVFATLLVGPTLLPRATLAAEDVETESDLRASYCQEDTARVSDEELKALWARSTHLERAGQHGLAREELCRIAVRNDSQRLLALQAIRRGYVATSRKRGVSSLLVDLIPELVGLSEQLAGEPARQAKLAAGRRLDELEAIDADHPQVAELQRMLGRGLTQQSETPTSWTARARSLFGIVVLLGLAVALSSDRKRISLRLVAWGLGLQLFFALIILLTPPGKWVFDGARTAITRVLSFTDQGADLVFGNLYRGLQARGADGPVRIVDGSSGDLVDLGLIVAFHVLPTIIFFGALMSVLFHLGVVQRVVKSVAVVMQRTMGTSGSESLSAAGNIFVGQTEAPLVVKSYLPQMTQSELMAVMCGGFATVAGGVLAAYTRFGLDPGHLLAASVMSAPAALVIAKIMLPESETSATGAGATESPERTTTNVIDAAATGATDGLKLAANVGAMLIAFIGLIALLNYLIGLTGSLVGFDRLVLADIFGTLFYPLSWCMGVDTQDLGNFGNLLGIKVSINEFVAFVELGALRGQMTERSVVIATYALTGFANFSSIGIQIGGLAALAPERRQDLAALGLKAMIGGAIASWITACIAGVIL